MSIGESGGSRDGAKKSEKKTKLRSENTQGRLKTITKPWKAWRIITHKKGNFTTIEKKTKEEDNVVSSTKNDVYERPLQ